MSPAKAAKQIILMILISKLFMKYMDTPVVQNIFTALRPVVVGLLRLQRSC